MRAGAAGFIAIVGAFLILLLIYRWYLRAADARRSVHFRAIAGHPSCRRWPCSLEEPHA